MFLGINGRVSRIVNLRRRGGIGGIPLGELRVRNEPVPETRQTLGSRLGKALVTRREICYLLVCFTEQKLFTLSNCYDDDCILLLQYLQIVL